MRLLLNRFSILLLTAPAFLQTPELFAQTNSEINAGFQFNFSNPGARSLSLAGAFIGLADDATTAYTNPAGLTNLSKAEVSLEGRYFNFTNQFLDRGRASGPPTGTGLDTVAERIDAETEEEITGLSFASFVLPGSRWALAVYRHELANFEATNETFGAFLDDELGNDNRFFPVQASVDLEIVSYGASFAVRFAEGFSIGVGVARFEYQQKTRLTRFGLGDIFTDQPDYSAANAVSRETVDGDDSDVAFNAGILWKAGRAFSIGAVYRQGPDFELEASSEDTDSGIIDVLSGEFHVPDVYGAGITIRPTDFFTISFDYNRILYSEFTDGLLDLTFQDLTGYEIDDGNEFRLGLQYVLPLGGSVLALRGGAWHDPDHRVRFTGTDIAERLLFRGGDDEIHYTGGLGLALGERFQIDAGADISDQIQAGSASMVVRF